MRDVSLGDYVVDMISGFEGVAIAKMEHLFGGVEFKLQQRKLDDNDRPFEPVWVEAGRLTLKEKSICFEDDGCQITDADLNKTVTG